MDEIVRLGTSGHDVLFTTHDPNHALRAATPAFLLRDGTRIADGVARDVLTRGDLEAIYRAPARVLSDARDGTNAFLPG